MRNVVIAIERYRHKRLPSFDDKSSIEASAKLRFNIGGLVQNQCSTEFSSWKKVSVDLKNSMLQELSISLLFRILMKPMRTNGSIWTPFSRGNFGSGSSMYNGLQSAMPLSMSQLIRSRKAMMTTPR
ncbi:hypothetical protein DVH24_014260 [Malus domestica]|uniref:Uncharacterized protein n=1 Tax=Malus domestica TaxID=3750 RepID=A0A498JI70_MALDO|nr:hypothetical protein DVH24_014260 [Malus domestica]